MENIKCPACNDGNLILVDNEETGERYYECDKCHYKNQNLRVVHANVRCPECNYFLEIVRTRRLISGGQYHCTNCGYKAPFPKRKKTV
ncbi:MAG: hypothetical protein K6C32_05315 [Bacilli bacterium]|nr:hypothetical protein [Bacilli bacterium]